MPGNIGFDQPCRGGREPYLTEPAALSKNRQRPFVSIELVQLEIGDFTGPGTGLEQQLQDRIVPHPIGFG